MEIFFFSYVKLKTICQLTQKWKIMTLYKCFYLFSLPLLPYLSQDISFSFFIYSFSLTKGSWLIYLLLLSSHSYLFLFLFIKKSGSETILNIHQKKLVWHDDKEILSILDDSIKKSLSFSLIIHTTVLILLKSHKWIKKKTFSINHVFLQNIFISLIYIWLFFSKFITQFFNNFSTL